VLLSAALIAALLTLFIGKLPQFDLVQAQLNDDNFTDLVLKTRGELSIDTNILIVTYDQQMFDTFDRVDRARLATCLAALMELKPRAVAIDYLLEDERPEAPDGDAMLAGILQEHPNIILGVFHEDSLDRFRMPPASFGIDTSRLGCVNLKQDDDQTIRTFNLRWGNPNKHRFESLAFRLARHMDSTTGKYTDSFDENTFIIDYAAGIGEQQFDENSAGAKHVFPAIPIESIFQTVMSGDTSALAFLRSQFAGKGVLVGYGDVRNSQITSIIDRFYTPLKPEKNSLPDMHGVAIHANVVNTIVKHRIIEVVPTWINVLWGVGIILVLLVSRDVVRQFPNTTRRTIVRTSILGLLLILAVMLPVLAFRYTSYKFSIYTPFAGLLLATPTMEGIDKGRRLLRDLRRRRRLRRSLPPALQASMLDILRVTSPDERMQRSIHLLQREFHSACAVLFDEASKHDIINFDRQCVASPTSGRMVEEIGKMREIDMAPPSAQQAVKLIGALIGDPTIGNNLRMSRSLYIAANEIRRQRAALEVEQTETEQVEATDTDTRVTYTDLMMVALSEDSGGREEEFNRLYSAIEGYAVKAAEILRTAGTPSDLINPDDDLFPYAIRRRCQLHGVEELFIYFNEQEDANNRDDFFDIVYCGRTIDCQPTHHPGLSEFREYVALTEERKAENSEESPDPDGGENRSDAKVSDLAGQSPRPGHAADVADINPHPQIDGKVFPEPTNGDGNGSDA
jgi:CHASE2 domain-containing sensor protein